MKNILTAQEAFAALQKGKTVLCRPIGDMLDFSDLDSLLFLVNRVLNSASKSKLLSWLALHSQSH
ncbi:hypothetical protein ACINIS123_2240 [Acinetobacter baumannii IS-123]|nr:hypothetical protein ACINIS123_2240 [Acinetobacter baumannii IS-123]